MGRLDKDSARVDILSIATAVPKNEIRQEAVRDEAAPYLAGMEHMIPIFAHTGVETRHMVKPVTWYHEQHDWVARTQVFKEAAFELLLDVTQKCLADAGAAPQDIDGIVLVTSTGITVPTLDALIANHLCLPLNIERTPIFGLGCAGGASGLARAAQLAQARKGSTILFLAVEICSANLSLIDVGKTDALGFALFGDGAVGMLLRSGDATATGDTKAIARYIASGESLWRDTEDLAGIIVRGDSLGLSLSPSLVAFVRQTFGGAARSFLSRQGFSVDDLSGVVLHAGASRMIDAAVESLGIDQEWVESSRTVLRDYGNLSACSVLFVLAHALRSGAAGRHLMAAFGPGFTISFLVLDLKSESSEA